VVEDVFVRKFTMLNYIELAAPLQPTQFNLENGLLKSTQDVCEMMFTGCKLAERRYIQQAHERPAQRRSNGDMSELNRLLR